MSGQFALIRNENWQFDTEDCRWDLTTGMRKRWFSNSPLSFYLLRLFFPSSKASYMDIWLCTGIFLMFNSEKMFLSVGRI